MSTLPPSPFLNSTVSPRAVVSTADSACRLQNVARPDATAERDPHSIPSSDGRRQSLADGSFMSGSTLGLPDSSESAVASSDLQPRAAAELLSKSTLAPATGVGTAAGPEFADPPVPAAVRISVSDGDLNSSLPRANPVKIGESEPSVMLACAPSESLPTSSTGGPQETPASAPTKNPDAGVLAKCNCEYAHCEDFDRPDCKAKAAGLDPWPDGATDCIHEIFHYVRKLMKPPPTFVLDADAFMTDVEEIPLFLRDDDGYLRRQA